jgi:pimeloyl-ACP methyl ester carboxylesterase
MRGRLWVFVVAAAALSAQQVPLGQIIDDVVCAKDATQHYALYLPSNYTPESRWPLILAFDPGGRGRRPLEQYLAAAEKYGYIVAGSNVSRNGSWSVSIGAAQAMGADVTARFTIDEKRVYTAGMSGGARVAMGLAMGSPKVISGVVASSAGYPDSKPRKTLPFVVFGTAGNEDFNWLEMRSLDHALTSPHHVAIFEGGHVWLPSELAVEAVEWLEVQAMRAGKLTRDQQRLDRLFDARHAKAMAMANEWQRCQALEALAVDFKDLHDVAAVTASAAALRRGKAVREMQKKEQAEEFQERRMLGDILECEQELNMAEKRSEAFGKLTDQWKRLDAQAKASDDSAARRIARRVSRGLAMGATDRTKDGEYLKLLATYRPGRMGPR